MQSNAARRTGWVFSVLASLFLIGVSGIPKFRFVQWDGKAEMFEKLGLTTALVEKIGVLEIALAVLFLIPRGGFLGAVLLTGYLGGAVVTHLRLGDSFFFPILVGVVIWISLGLRRPEVFALAFGKPPQSIT